MREVAADAGILIDPLSVGEITDAMVRVAEDAALRAKLSTKGLKRSSEFSWQKTAQLTIETYAEAAAYSPPRRGGVDAPSEATAQTGWSARRTVTPELTTPSLRATPPLRGGEYFARVRAAIHKTIE